MSPRKITKTHGAFVNFQNNSPRSVENTLAFDFSKVDYLTGNLQHRSMDKNHPTKRAEIRTE